MNKLMMKVKMNKIKTFSKHQKIHNKYNKIVLNRKIFNKVQILKMNNIKKDIKDVKILMKKKIWKDYLYT